MTKEQAQEAALLSKGLFVALDICAQRGFIPSHSFKIFQPKTQHQSKAPFIRMLFYTWDARTGDTLHTFKADYPIDNSAPKIDQSEYPELDFKKVQAVNALLQVDFDLWFADFDRMLREIQTIYPRTTEVLKGGVASHIN